MTRAANQTRLSQLLETTIARLKLKYVFFQTQFSNSVFFFFLGFLSGNIFGTFLPQIRRFFPWDGFLIASFLFLIELLSYNRYGREGRAFLFFWKFLSLKQISAAYLFENNVQKTLTFNRQNKESKDKDFLSIKKSFWKVTNFFKIGLLVGFFIDAFKVGS
jgi:hypothetical protein